MRKRVLLFCALALAAAGQDPGELRQAFANPPAEFRPMPLWVWHDEMRWLRLAEQLAQFKQQGFGGVFVHPRPGLMTEYLGQEWFRLWRRSLDEGKRLGLIVNIYDENSYPAGFAGGHVPSRAPDTVVQGVQPEMDVEPARVPWNAPQTVGVFAVERDAAGRVTSAKRLRGPAELAPGQHLAVFRLYRAQAEQWTAGFPYVDLTHPDTGRVFLETTFEAYKKHVGAEFGKTVRWAFDDEPLLAAGGAYSGTRIGLPLSYNTLAEFRKRCGYDLAGSLASLYWDVGEFQKVRFDYWQTLHDLWKENYFERIYKWCDRNGLQFTGHWMEHEWPYPWITPADASFYAFEHMPGIDMLTGLQALGVRTGGADPFMLFTVRQMSSVAEQLGRRAFAESFGASGYDATLEHFKLLGDWLMVHGVNFINPCQSFGTIRGARKRDYPPSFTDVSPWWAYYRTHADHMSRVCYMLSRGAVNNRVLVLEPTTSGFLWARRGAATPELGKMREDYASLIQFLADRQVDFHLGDEYILEWFGKQNGKRLAIGKAAYDLIVWPQHMSNVRRQTVPRLEKFLAAGGVILALGPPAAYVDGRPSDAVVKLNERYPAQWRTVESLPALWPVLERTLPPRIRFDPPVAAGVGFAERFLASGERILFLTNSNPAPLKAHATVEGRALEHWDTLRGEAAALPYQASGGSLTFSIDLPPAGSEMLLVRDSGAPARAVSQPRFISLAAGKWQIRPEAPNVLVLDYCDLKTRGLEQPRTNTWRANWTLWQAHGFERPAWDNAVQFRTRVFDRNHFDAASGFQASFRFQAAAAALGSLELAMECPELYQVTINGAAVDFERGSRWLDPHVKTVPVAALARNGENLIQVTGRPFDVRMELENVYVRGQFWVQPSQQGFRLAPPAGLDFGAWSKQGRPFYSDPVLYEAAVDVPAATDGLRVELPRWAGAVAEILLDGRRVALVGWQPYAAEFPAPPGKHTLGVRVVPTPRNLLGPFHRADQPRMVATPGHWANPPEQQPPGLKYDVLDYGLMDPPRISARLAP